jgi:hypothetical protein
MKIGLPKWNAVKDDVREGVEDVVDQTGAAIDDAVDKLGPKAERAARDLGKDAERTAREARKAAERAAKDLRKDAQRAANEMSKDAEHAARDAERAAKQLGKDAGKASKQAQKELEKAGHAASRAADDLGDDVRQRAADTPSALRSLAGDLADAARNGHSEDGEERWIRLPKIPMPRIEMTDMQLPEIRLPHVIGGSVRSTPQKTERRFGGILAAAAGAALHLGGRLARASGRAIVPRRRSPIQQVGGSLPLIGIVVVAAGTGAMLAYAFDPVAGRARRARARDQMAAGARQIGRRLSRAQRYATSTVAGKVEQVRAARREMSEQESRRQAHPAPPQPEIPPREMVGATAGDDITGNGLG